MSMGYETSLVVRESAKAALVAERARTAARIAGLTRSFDDIVASSAITPPDDEHDPEGSTVAFERAQVAALLDDARGHLAEVELAHDRLERGTYGICERCGQRIAPGRLRARPAARTCVACAAASRR